MHGKKASGRLRRCRRRVGGRRRHGSLRLRLVVLGDKGSPLLFSPFRELRQVEKVLRCHVAGGKGYTE